MRAAKAAAVTAYLSEDSTLGLGSSQTGDVTVNYDANNGKLITGTPTDKYGKGTGTSGGTATYMGYTNTTDVSGKYIAVKVASNGTITETWQ